MELPFSVEEIEKALEKDAGFRSKLASMSASGRNLITEILRDRELLDKLGEILPGPVKKESIALLKRAVDYPNKATQLYKECRFLEARKLLEETIRIYSSVRYTGCAPLDEAAAFVVTRLSALCYDLLGDIEWNLGNSIKAAEHHEKALQLAMETGDRGTIAKALLGLGIHHWELGNYERALELTRDALGFLDGVEDYWGIRDKVYSVLSVCHDDLGNSGEALECALNAIEIALRLTDRKHLPEILNNLACLYMAAGELSRAIDTLEEARSIAEAEKEFRQEVVILNNLAACYLNETFSGDDVNLALGYILSASKILDNLESPPLEAFTSLTTALICQAAGESDKATGAFQKAIEINHSLGAREREALALTELAFHLKYYCNDIQNSVLACKQAIRILEALRTNIKREAYRISYASSRVDPYEMILDSLVNIGQHHEALIYAEKAKSRVLSDYMKAFLEDREFLKKDRGILKECLKLLREIEELQKNLKKVTEQEFRTFSWNDEKVREVYSDHSADLKMKLEERTRAYNKTYSELVRFDPESASLVMADSELIQDTYVALDEETLIVELFQAEDKLYEFIIAKDGLVNTRTIDISFENASELVFNLRESLRQNMDVRSHEFIRQVRKPLALLHDALISPVFRLLDTNKRVIFIPHLFWHYVPFCALWDKSQKRYLCDLVEIGSCPSISVLSLCLAKERTKRDKALIVARDTGNIPYVYKEAEQLASAFYPDCHVLKDEDANLRHLASLGNNFDVIHFAVHGYFDHEQPYLSGIDIPPDSSSSRRSYVVDLFNLELRCNLITVSACESGLSKITRADELIGLCRGIFYAGATSVMLSLWKVADESSCYLMENFYWHYVKNRKTKTRALQLAMQAVKSKREYSHPFYWAPFVIMGDWR